MSWIDTSAIVIFIILALSVIYIAYIFYKKKNKRKSEGESAPSITTLSPTSSVVLEKLTEAPQDISLEYIGKSKEEELDANEWGSLRSYLARMGVKQSDINDITGTEKKVGQRREELCDLIREYLHNQKQQISS